MDSHFLHHNDLCFSIGKKETIEISHKPLSFIYSSFYFSIALSLYLPLPPSQDFNFDCLVLIVKKFPSNDFG